jgi:DNA polymerase elongation subunit (family B)
MIETDFIPIDYDYFDFKGRNYTKIIGRDSKGKRLCIIDSCPVYLWAILKDKLSKKKTERLIDKVSKIKLDIKGRQTKVESVELHEKNFLGRKVKALKIFATNYKDLHDIADKLGLPEIEARRGYDLGFSTHYILEKKLLPLHWYKIQGELLNNSQEYGGIDMGLDIDTCIEVKEIKELDENPDFNPKVLAYDIETDEFKIGGGEILMVSLVGKDFKKVITWKKTNKSKPGYVEYVKDEAELLETFVKNVREFSPDFLIGYFSDGFDLPYLRARADKMNINLGLGLDDSKPKFSRGTLMTGKISGIVHLDMLRFIQTAYSQYMQSETLSLDEVSKEFLGNSKKPFKHKHSDKIEDSQWNEYYEYNLHDSVLTLGLFEKMWPDILEFTRIMQEPVFDVTRNGMSSNVEDFIIHNLEKFNEIPERRPSHEEIGSRRRKGKYEGAFVFEPIPGLYEKIAVFDFTSSYGTTIVTYNLSKSTLLEKEDKKSGSHSIEINGKEVYFSKKSGFFPEMLKEIIEKRKRYKRELSEKPDVIKRARSNAYKLLANASYGYQGFFGARYYCREAAAATAAFARQLIKEVIEKINKSGYKVIYSDTDSIAFSMEGKSEKETLSLLKKINSQLPGIMELELEGFFRRGLWVTKRSGKIGAKKKYALLGKDGKIKIRGFETVRRDWCPLARKLQNKVLELVLQDGNEKRALEYTKDIIKKLKERKISREELIIKTMLKKPLAEYRAITPHVIAARKMKEKELPISGGNMVEYFISEPKEGEKRKLVRDRVKLPEETGKYDIKYYLDKQLLPAIENILQVFGVEGEEVIEGKKQDKLSNWIK